jgi:signal transduction histidine kinase
VGGGGGESRAADLRSALAWSLGGFAIAAAITTAIWSVSHPLATRSVAADARLISGQVGERIRACVQTRAEMIVQIRREWSLGVIRDDVELAARAAALMETFPGYLDIGRVNELGVIEFVYPPEQRPGVLGRSVSENAGSIAEYERAVSEGVPRLSPAIELLQAGTGAVVYVPIEPSVPSRSVFVGVFRTASLIPACLGADDVSGYALAIHDQDKLLFARAVSSPVEELGATASLPLYNRTWTLRLVPGRHQVDATLEPLRLILINGLPLSVAIGVLLFVLISMRNRARVRARVAEEQRAQERQKLEAKLYEVQRMEALGKLAAAVAHDFNNLLTVIAISTHKMSSRPGDPHTQELRDIKTAADRGVALTRELVVFGRGDTNPTEAIELGALVKELRGVLTRLTGDKVSLEIRTPDAPASIRGSRVQLEQILVNLVVNAVQAMADGGQLLIEVAISEHKVTLTVADTGSGIEPAVLPRIFEPFFTTKGPDHGTGLGLATVYSHVQRMEGILEVESTVGVGTRFIATFPLVQPDAA